MNTPIKYYYIFLLLVLVVTPNQFYSMETKTKKTKVNPYDVGITVQAFKKQRREEAKEKGFDSFIIANAEQGFGCFIAKSETERLVLCKICGVMIMGKNFFNHIQAHANQAYHCDVCTKILKTFNKYSQHQKMHGIYPCERCGNFYYAKKDLLQHEIEIHTKYNRWLSDQLTKESRAKLLIRKINESPPATPQAKITSALGPVPVLNTTTPSAYVINFPKNINALSTAQRGEQEISSNSNENDNDDNIDKYLAW